MGRQTKVHLYALITIFVWATGFSFTKLALAHFSPNAVGLLRYLIASAALLPFVLLQKMKLPSPRDIPLFFAAGAMGFSLYMVTFNQGMRTLTSATSSILIATAPILTALLAIFCFKEKIYALGFCAVAIEFGGILILTLWNGAFSINEGVLWTLAAALLISGYNLMQRVLTRRYTALQSTAYSIFAGTLLLLVFLPETLVQLPTAPAVPLGAVIFMGLFPSALGYVFWAKALSIARMTSTVTNYMFLTPFLSTLLGYLVVIETPDFSTLLGGALILLGLILFRVSARDASPVLPEPQQPGSQQSVEEDTLM